MCYIPLERAKLCRHGCLIFAQLLDAKMKIHVFENYMVIYTGRKMDENLGDFREEQRAYCEIRGLLAHQKLSLNWIQCTEKILFHIEQLPDGYLILKKVDLVLKMRARPGRSVSASSENDVATVQSIVQQDSRYTVEEISDLSGLKSSYAFTSLKENLKLQKICARWIPHLLTPEQEKDRVEKASVLLSTFENRDSSRLREVVTGDEIWLYYFEPDNKLNNKIWVGENNERPVVGRRSRSVRRVMYALRWNCGSCFCVRKL